MRRSWSAEACRGVREPGRQVARGEAERGVAHGRRGYRPGPARVRSTDDRRGRRPAAAEHAAAARTARRASGTRAAGRRPRRRARGPADAALARCSRVAVADPRRRGRRGPHRVLGSFDIGAGLLAVSAFIGWAVAVAVVWGSDPAPNDAAGACRRAVGSRRARSWWARWSCWRTPGQGGVMDPVAYLDERSAAGRRRHPRRRRRGRRARPLTLRASAASAGAPSSAHCAHHANGRVAEARDRMKNLRSIIVLRGDRRRRRRRRLPVPRSPERERERAAGRRLLPGAQRRFDQRRPAPAVHRGARRRGLRRRQLSRATRRRIRRPSRSTRGSAPSAWTRRSRPTRDVVRARARTSTWATSTRSRRTGEGRPADDLLPDAGRRAERHVVVPQGQPSPAAS